MQPTNILVEVDNTKALAIKKSTVVKKTSLAIDSFKKSLFIFEAKEEFLDYITSNNILMTNIWLKYFELYKDDDKKRKQEIKMCFMNDLITFITDNKTNNEYQNIVNNLKIISNKYLDKFEPYFTSDTLEFLVFETYMNMYSSYKTGEQTENVIKNLYNTYCYSGKYNRIVLIDFFNQLKKFPEPQDFSNYCDERIRFIEDLRILIELLF